MYLEVRSDREVGAKLFRGLGDGTRLAILQTLASGERRVTDLVAELGSSQSNISAHLACLKGCGLVEDRPEGRAVFYKIASNRVFPLLEAAELLLAGVGQQVHLCPVHAPGGNGE
ncbi:MAG TPA: metalloregulator ArsR/SmtB family transcription factor [Acidimicrobiia bacterium]|nr:metalloregulator ArsR/SmtB family transcription factor [Acidimicrobiia bacterium]